MKIIDNYKNSLIIDNAEYFIKLTNKIKLIINSKKDVKLIFFSENYNEDVEIFVNSSITLDIYELSINSNSKKYIYQNEENSIVNYYHGNINKNNSNIFYKVFVIYLFIL